MPIKIRAPWWKRRAWTITINGTKVNALTSRSSNWQIAPSSYFQLRQTSWSGTSTIGLGVPQTLRFETARGASSTGPGGIMFGPVVLTSPGQSSYRTISTSSSSRSSSTSASWTIGGVSMTPHYSVTSSYNTYNRVSSIPSTWRDTTWETQVPSSMSGAEGARALMAAPAVELVKSRLQVSFSAAAPADQALRVQLFNAQGVMVADLKGMLQKDARTVTLAQPKGTLAAGMYVASVTAGERNFRTPLIGEK